MSGKITFKILTKKNSGHRETEVTINWNGVSVEDLKILAKSAIIRDLQAKIQAGVFDTFPEKVEVVAKNLIHHDSPAEWEYREPPKKPQGEKEKSPANKDLEKLLKKLSPAELRALMN